MNMLLLTLLTALAGDAPPPEEMPFDATGEPEPVEEPAAPTGPLTREQWSKLPSTLPYTEGGQVPEFYELRTRKRGGMIVAGAVMIGVPWLVGVPVAITDTTFYEGRLWPLFVPVGGPIGAAANFQTSAPATAILVMDSLVQTSGLALIIAGSVSTQTRLERVPFERLSIGLMPTPGGGQGVVISGRW